MSKSFKALSEAQRESWNGYEILWLLRIWSRSYQPSVWCNSTIYLNSFEIYNTLLRYIIEKCVIIRQLQQDRQIVNVDALGNCLSTLLSPIMINQAEWIYVWKKNFWCINKYRTKYISRHIELTTYPYTKSKFRKLNYRMLGRKIQVLTWNAYFRRLKY